MPIVRDEHGSVVPDPSRPEIIQTEAQDERWQQCVRVAQLFTGKAVLDVETRNMALVLFDGPLPTNPPTPYESKPGRLREAIATETKMAMERAAKRRRRNRLGRFADEFSSVRSSGPKAPQSPGVSYAQIEALGLNKWPEPGPQAIELLAGHADTVSKYAVPNSPGIDERFGHGHYTAARRVVHDAAIARALAGMPSAAREADKPTGVAELLGVDHPIVQKLATGKLPSDEEAKVIRDAADAARDGNPDALFTAGGPASGKTTVLTRERDTLRPKNAVTVDPDGLKESLPEYVELRAIGDHYAASAVHTESGDLAERLTRESMALGLNLVLDGTGNGDPGQFKRLLNRQHERGYDVRLLYVSIPTDEAVVSAINRAEEEGRFVPLPRVRELHKNVSRVFVDEISDIPWLEALDVYERKLHIASQIDGKLVEFDKKRMDAFRAKAHEGEPGQLSLGEANYSPDGPGPVPPERWSIEDPWDFDFIEREPITYEDDDEPVAPDESDDPT